MSTDPRHYDVILSPVITGEAASAAAQNKVVFRVKSSTRPTANKLEAQSI